MGFVSAITLYAASWVACVTCLSQWHTSSVRSKHGLSADRPGQIQQRLDALMQHFSEGVGGLGSMPQSSSCATGMRLLKSSYAPTLTAYICLCSMLESSFFPSQSSSLSMFSSYTSGKPFTLYGAQMCSVMITVFQSLLVSRLLLDRLLLDRGDFSFQAENRG